MEEIIEIDKQFIFNLRIIKNHTGINPLRFPIFGLSNALKRSHLMKKIYTFLLVFALIQSSFGQEATKSSKTPAGGRPNIPSDLTLEFGFSRLNNRPEELKTRFFGSRTVNVYYQYPIALGGKASGFTINPGIGIGIDRYSFNGTSNLFNAPSIGIESSEFIPVADVYGKDIELKRNLTSTTYLDVPIDFTYHLNKTNYSKGFRVSLGAKVGYLLDAKTRIKYIEKSGLVRDINDYQNFGFEKIRYGISLKAGSPGFYIWGYYGLNGLFQEDQGPFRTGANQISFGLAFKVF